MRRSSRGLPEWKWLFLGTSSCHAWHGFDKTQRKPYKSMKVHINIPFWKTDPWGIQWSTNNDILTIRPNSRTAPHNFPFTRREKVGLVQGIPRQLQGPAKALMCYKHCMPQLGHCSQLHTPSATSGIFMSAQLWILPHGFNGEYCNRICIVSIQCWFCCFGKKGQEL